MRLLTPEGNFDPTRRAVAGSLFFSGYAVAAVSSCAAPVTTPSDELIAEDVHLVLGVMRCPLTLRVRVEARAAAPSSS